MDNFVLSAFSSNDCEYQFDWENVRFSLNLDSGLFQSEDRNQHTNETMHTHPKYEWFFVTNGSMRVVTEQQTLILKKNDFVIIRPGLEHYVNFLEDATTRYNLSFSAALNGFASTENLWDGLHTLLESAECVYGSGGEEMADINKRISQLCGTGRRSMICACFVELMMSVQDVLGGQPMDPVQKLLTNPALSRSEKLRQLFDSYYMYDLSLEFVADKIGISSRQLNRVIRQEYDCTYHERLSYMRVCSASQLLKKTDFTVREIASWVGYSSLCGFYNAFKSQCGCLPTEYRKLSAKKEEQK